MNTPNPLAGYPTKSFGASIIVFDGRFLLFNFVVCTFYKVGVLFGHLQALTILLGGGLRRIDVLQLIATGFDYFHDLFEICLEEFFTRICTVEGT